MWNNPIISPLLAPLRRGRERPVGHKLPSTHEEGPVIFLVLILFWGLFFGPLFTLFLFGTAVIMAGNLLVKLGIALTGVAFYICSCWFIYQRYWRTEKENKRRP